MLRGFCYDVYWRMGSTNMLLIHMAVETTRVATTRTIVIISKKRVVRMD